MLLQLTPVPTREAPSTAMIEAIATLDQQRAIEGAFLILSTGAVLVLQLHRRRCTPEQLERASDRLLLRDASLAPQLTLIRQLLAA